MVGDILQQLTIAKRNGTTLFTALIDPDPVTDNELLERTEQA